MGKDRQEVTIVGTAEIAAMAKNRGGRNVQPLVEDDGSQRSWALQVLRRTSGGAEEVVALAESDGTLITSLQGKDSSGNQVSIAVEPTTGELRVVNGGKDAAGNIDEFLTGANQEQVVRNFTVWQDVNPVEIPAAEGDLWDPGGTSAEVYEVEFYIVNNDAGSAAVSGVYVGLDLASGGTLAAPEYWMFNETIPYPGSSGWRGPFIMRGDDQIRGVAAAANDVSIHFRIKRVDASA